MTIEELNNKEYGLFKFVELGDNIIFAETDVVGNPKHIELIDKEDLKKVTGAGTIFLFTDYWKFMGRGSDSIERKIDRPVGCSKSTEDKIKRLIIRKYREK